MRPRDLDKAVDRLIARFGDLMSTNAHIRAQHGRDESFHAEKPPDAVFFPSTTKEVSEAVQICSRYGVPMIPFGAGTSLEGHVAALKGGVTFDLSRMNAILAVNDSDLDCAVEAGVTRRQLNAYLRDTGLFFPVDPGAEATIGGMCATGASGTNSVRYGTIRENVLGLTCVTANGDIVRTGGRARKSAAGYDLTRLMLGSEGTLGIVTEINLRLHGIPEAVSVASCSFESLEAAVNVVIATIQMGIPMARIELLDDVQIKACNAYSNLNLPELPTLFLEFHGSTPGVTEQARQFGDIADEYGGGQFDWAIREEGRRRLWKARHDVLYAALNSRPGAKGLITDVCVPISHLAACILETKQDVARLELHAPLVGHAGDGNFHLIVLLDPDDPAELKRAEELNERLIARALKSGGTCTGEHGIGLGKIKHLEREHGSALAMMQAVKRALDPENLMNPGKVVRLEM